MFRQSAYSGSNTAPSAEYATGPTARSDSATADHRAAVTSLPFIRFTYLVRTKQLSHNKAKNGRLDILPFVVWYNFLLFALRSLFKSELLSVSAYNKNYTQFFFYLDAALPVNLSFPCSGLLIARTIVWYHIFV